MNRRFLFFSWHCLFLYYCLFFSFSFILNCCICFNASSWHSFSALIFLCHLLFSSLLHTFFFQTANTAVHDSAYHSYFQSVPSQCLYGQNHRSEENIRYPFHNFTNHIYYGLCYKHESNQVQYRNVLSVKILAKISPSGSDAMIRSAAANQDAETDKDMIPRL